MSEMLPADSSLSRRNPVRAIREAKGYSVEKLSLTCGLATNELVEIENGKNADPAKLKRIASALQLPDSAFTTSN